MNVNKFYKNKRKENFKKKCIEGIVFGSMLAATAIGCQNIKDKYKQELEMMLSSVPYNHSIVREYDGYKVEYSLSKNGFGYDEKIGFWSKNMPNLDDKVGVIFYDDDKKEYNYTVTEVKNLLPLIEQFKKEKRSFAAYSIVDENYK
ncbi:MAG: hypothetical protein QXS41_03295 [Candidatus Woesearchaeota archaeon]